MQSSENNRTLHEHSGKPPCIDDIGIETVKGKLVDDRKKLNSTKKGNLNKYLIEERQETKKRRNQSIESEDERISSKTVKRIKSSHHIIDRKAQITTTARVNALKDGRVTYLTACLLEGEDILCFLCYFLSGMWHIQRFQVIFQDTESGTLTLRP